MKKIIILLFLYQWYSVLVINTLSELHPQRLQSNK